MKHLAILILASLSIHATPIAVGPNGEGIANPDFRNAVLPTNATPDRYLKSDGAGGVTWAEAAAALTNTAVNGVLDDDPSASRTALGLGTAATYATADLPVSTATQTALDWKQEIPYIPVSTKTSWTRNTNTASGITLSTSRRRIEITNSSTNPKLVYTNSSKQSGTPVGRHIADNNALNTITVKAAIENDAGVITPVYFSGARTITIPVDGSLVISDALAGYALTAGKSYYIRTLVTIPTSGVVTLNAVHDNSSSPGEGRIDGVDNVDSGTITTGTGYSYTANMVIAQPTGLRKNRPVIGLIGDSIFDQSVGGNYSYEDSWASAALGPERGRNYSHVRLSVGAYSPSAYYNAGAESKMKPYFPYLTHVVCNLGINDVRGSPTEAEMKTYYLQLWRDLKAAGVEKIWQCTLTPDQSAASTDEPIRLAINTWIRTVPNPLYGIIENSTAMESSSGVWNASYVTSPDFLHPNATGAAVLKTLMPLSFFD